MNKAVLSGLVFILLAGIFGTFANAQEIPSWVKNNAGYWADGFIDDATFVNSLQFLIAENIVIVAETETETAEVHSGQIPSWVKNNAGYWAQDAITDSDFIGGIQFLIANGIITVDDGDDILTSLHGKFHNGDFVHQTSGSAKIESSNEKIILYLSDDFKTLNGPDLYVYLATDKHANDYVDLGMIQRFSGLQSYDVPDDVDFEKYGEVLIWCKSFGVLFGNAPLEK